MNYEVGRIPALWGDDAEAMKNLRDFLAEKSNERLIRLMRSLGHTTKLPTDSLSDADIRSFVHLPMSGRHVSASGR